MPAYFIVSTKAETPKLWISQRSLGEIQQALRQWPYSFRHLIHELRVLPNPGAGHIADPQGCSTLACVARIEPEDRIEHYRLLWEDAIDQLPPEQAVEEIQKAVDGLAKSRSKFLEPTQIASTGS
jgi:hypothetical protein